jgi:hypothetical protein
VRQHIERRIGSDPNQKAARSRKPVIAGLAIAISAGIAMLATTAPHETQAQAMQRCRTLGALSYDTDHPHGLKALDRDEPAVRASHLDLSQLPQGWSHLSDGEGVLVTEGCAFVEPTGARKADGTATSRSTNN